jgi:hypothetical protein
MENQTREKLPLNEAVTHLLEECRMVLPGIQALFGFLLIAVFNSRFGEQLTSTEQMLHLVAIILVVIAIALVMAPAAYHRQTCPKEVTLGFLTVATQLLLWSMFPLMVGICLDFYLIARLILNSELLSLVLSLGLLFMFSTLWFLLPRLKILRDILRS